MKTIKIDKYNYNDVLHNTREKESKLSLEQQILINQEVDDRAKSLPTIWVIWLAFGLWGGHRFYMHDSAAGWMLALTIIGFATTLFIVGWLVLLAALIWKIVDACHLCQWIHINRLSIRKELVDNATK